MPDLTHFLVSSHLFYHFVIDFTFSPTTTTTTTTSTTNLSYFYFPRCDPLPNLVFATLFSPSRCQDTHQYVAHSTAPL